MQLRMDIPVHHAQCVWQKKRTYVKGQGQGHRKHENHYVSHNFWTGSRRDFWVGFKMFLVKISIRSVAWRSVFASHAVNSEPIDFTIGTHIDFTCTIYHIKNCTNKNNITRITMATKYPIIKHRAFFKTLIAGISPIHTGRILMKLRVWNFFKINTSCLQTTKHTLYPYMSPLEITIGVYTIRNLVCYYHI